MTKKTIKIGIISRGNYKNRTIAIARGKYKPRRGEPKVWFESVQSMAQVLSSENQELLRIIEEKKPESLKQLEAADYNFDLVITDLVMPNISGVAITSILKKHNPRMPIIAITGYGEQPGSLAREAHADIVIDKPFKLDEIESTIKRLLNQTA